jgi:predicted nucleotidyltransferase
MRSRRESVTMSAADRKGIRAALSELQAALQKLYGQDAPALVIYGSHARRQAQLESDIDVLLLYAKDVQRGREIQRVSPILADLNLRYHVLISILPATAADYGDGASPFWMNVRREGVRLDAL